MRTPILGFALLLLVALPLFAVSPTIVDDVVRMTKAGVPDDTILIYIHAKVDRFDVSADDIVAMKDAGVSDEVIRAIIDEATVRNPQPAVETPQPAPPAGPQETPAEQADSGTRVVVDTAPLPPYLWDPWWFMPTLDTKSGAPAPAAKTAPATAPPPKATPVAVPAPRNASAAHGSPRHIEWVDGLANALASVARAARR